MARERKIIDDDRMRSYSSAFSRNVFSAIVSYSDFSQLNWLLRKYDDNFFMENTYMDYMSYLYKHLIRSYRCEYVFKNEIINQILLKKYGTRNTIAFNEFKVGDSIVDLAMMNGESKAFEIKTPLDSPRRLKKQMRDYKKVFNKCYLVVDADECEYYAEIIDDYVGIVALSFLRGRIRVEEIRPALKRDAIDGLTAMKCLRTCEYENIIRHFYGELPSVPAYKMYEACSDLICKVDSASLNLLFLEEVKRRKSATERLKSFPKELRQMMLSLNLSPTNERLLIEKLNNKINSKSPCITRI
ncbi:MAG: sce7726 family protein [Prevotella sp.]